MTSELSTILTTVASLSAAARDDFNFWRLHLEPVLRMDKGVCKALAMVAQTTGTPLKTVQMKFYRLKKRGLLALVDRRLAGPSWGKSNKQVRISQSDEQLVKLYCDKNQRSSRSAVKQLRRDWQRGRVKTETPIDPRTAFPRGWSIDNLAR